MSYFTALHNVERRCDTSPALNVSLQPFSSGNSQQATGQLSRGPDSAKHIWRVLQFSSDGVPVCEVPCNV